MRSLDKRILALALVVAALVAVAVACEEGEEGGATPTQPPEETAAAPTPTEVALEPGVSDTEVVIGQHSILSGPAAIYAVIPDASRAYFEYINKTQGGVNGRKIVFENRDNQYPNPAEAKAVTQQLVEQVGVFAMFNNFGTPTHAAVIDYLNEQGIPDMYIATGFSGFTDPVRHYTFGGVPAYLDEAKVMARYLNENMPDAKVGVLFQNDDFGRDYVAGIASDFKGDLALSVAYDATEIDTSSQVAQLLNAGVDVIVLGCTPSPCASAIKSAREAGSDVQFIMSGVDNIDAMFALVGDPALLEGTLVVAYHKTVSDAEDPAVQKHIQIMKDAGIEPSNFTIYGQLLAELFIETLKRAGDPPTREGMIKAAESINGLQLDLALAPVCMSPTDHRPWEALKFWRAEGGQWVEFGDIISVESTTPCG